MPKYKSKKYKSKNTQKKKKTKKIKKKVHTKSGATFGDYATSLGKGIKYVGEGAWKGGKQLATKGKIKVLGIISIHHILQAGIK